MGLTSSLTNAVSGLRINQDSLDVVSRNIANSGTPGYHRQSLNVVDYNSQSATYARSSGVTRAFNQSLQSYYTRQVSDTANSGIQANYLDRFQGFLGKPGSAGSLDTLLGSLQKSMGALATSPDDFTTRSQAVASAQSMVEQLNQLSGVIQTMRRETEGQLASSVHDLNGMLNSLAEVNHRMLDLGMTDGARAQLGDQRDRLVSSVAEMIDIRADYRPDGTVALMTRSGVGLLDQGVSTFSFESAGTLSPTSLFDPDPEKTQVGKLSLTAPSGLTLDLVTQGVVQGGELGGLITLRDKTLVEAQAQLDEIAAGLAQAFSTNQIPGAPAEQGEAKGLALDLTGLQKGNDVLLTYSLDGIEQRVRVVNTTEPMDYKDASGQRVIGLNLSGDLSGSAVQLSSKLEGLAISVNAEGKLSVLDDGAAGRTDVKGAVARVTSAGTRGQGLGLNLFVDQGNAAFTNDIDGAPPQKQGFAARIAINSEIVADNRLLVQHEAGSTLGDAKRADYVLGQLKTMSFVSGGDPKQGPTRFQLTGNLSEVISQVIGYQGASVNAALSQADDRQLTLDTLVTQMDSEYGVNVDEEMSRLMEIQNAYAANARVVSVVKELLDALFAAA